MEKLIANCSYWLGVGCLAVALVWKVGAALGLFRPGYGLSGSVSYLTFLNGTILFFILTVATACHAWVVSRKG